MSPFVDTHPAPAETLKALSAAMEFGGGGLPVFGIWNAFVTALPESERPAAALRYADALCPEWRDYLSSQ